LLPEVACTVTGLLAGNEAGAVYVAVAAPVLVTVPKGALPPATPLTSHWIAAPGVTQSVAVND
jgi:hypothetical protein